MDVVSDLPPTGEYDLVHSYSNSHGGEIHTAECNMCQALDYSKRLSRHAVKYFVKGLDEIGDGLLDQIVFSNSRCVKIVEGCLGGNG